jgi:dihydroorotase
VALKECALGCAGCFTAPIAIPLLAGLFDQHDSLLKLEAFTSGYGAGFYGLKPNDSYITIERAEWEVPSAYGSDQSSLSVVPFKAGEKMHWNVVDA